MISPDYPGTVKRTVEEIVVAPACSCRLRRRPVPREALTGDVGAARRMGKLIGLDAARLALALQTRPTTRRLRAGRRIRGAARPVGRGPLPDGPIALAIASRRVALPVRDYGPADALEAEAARRAAAVRALDKASASDSDIATANYLAQARGE